MEINIEEEKKLLLAHFFEFSVFFFYCSFGKNGDFFLSADYRLRSRENENIYYFPSFEIEHVESALVTEGALDCRAVLSNPSTSPQP